MSAQLFRKLVVLLQPMKSYSSLFTIVAALMATFVISCSKHSQQSSQHKPISMSDADITAQMHGTWSEAPDGGQNFKTTFESDGQGVTLMWPVGQPESTALRLGISWVVTNGVLIRTITDTSDHKSFRIGRVLKTPVISLSSDQIVLADRTKQYTIHIDKP
jgi:hypothetical protein